MRASDSVKTVTGLHMHTYSPAVSAVCGQTYSDFDRCWWHMPSIPAHRRQIQARLKASQGYTEKLHL